jgi:hypothetical protein
LAHGLDRLIESVEIDVQTAGFFEFHDKFGEADGTYI